MLVVTESPTAQSPQERVGPVSWAGVDGFLVAVLIVWLLAIQRPWIAVPLPVTDVGPLLAATVDGANVWDRTTRLVEIAAADGRFMPASMFLLAVKMHVLGSTGADWRWASVAFGAAMVIVAYVALRRFDIVPLGAFAGASLFVFGDHASLAWLLPQVMEPIAVLFVLMAVCVAQRYRRTPHPERESLAICICLVAAVCVKEPMVAAIPFVLLIAWMWNGHAWTLTIQRDRLGLLVAHVALGVLLLNMVPILVVRFVASDPEYASRYAMSTLSLASLSNAMRASLLAVTRVPWFPVNVAAAGIVVAGLWAAGRERQRRQVLLGITISLVLPLTVALLYAPWPSFPGYYALPGTFGLALLLGVSLTSSWRGFRSVGRAGVVAAYVVMATLGTVVVTGAAAQYSAERVLEFRFARELRKVRANSVVVYGAAAPEFSGAYGRSLLLYATHYFGRMQLTAAADASCITASRLASLRGNTAVLTYDRECPAIGVVPSVMLDEPVFVRDWKTLQRKADTLRAMIFSESS